VTLLPICKLFASGGVTLIMEDMMKGDKVKSNYRVHHGKCILGSNLLEAIHPPTNHLAEIRLHVLVNRRRVKMEDA
jgi:hypothetical protein